jgi:hypothetical protein
MAAVVCGFSIPRLLICAFAHAPGERLIFGDEMTTDYSFWADCLSKFHTSTPVIQALWLLAMAGTACVGFYSICWCLRGMAFAFAAKQQPETDGQTLYSIARMDDGALRVFRHVPDLAEINREAFALLAKPQEAAMPEPASSANGAEPVEAANNQWATR